MLKLVFENEKPLNILCLGAHCDDIEIGAGGTLLRIFQEYSINSVNWIVFTSNEARKKEAEQSATIFLKNVANKCIEIKSWRDGYLPFNAWEVKDYFEYLKGETAPDIIFTHYRNDRHQDHRLISDLAWNTWRNHLVMEYEIPKYDGDFGNPNFYVGLDEEYIKKRNQIIFDSFKSQNGKHWFDDAIFLSLARLRGMETATQYSEAFYVRKAFL